jgi:peptidoglycan/xylan/chitin deacetylase (PgdA/CDA1 family)
LIEGCLKRASFRALERVGLIAIAEALAVGIPILAYHGITERRDSSLRNVRRLHIWKDRFEEHLRLLCAQWCPIPLSAVWEAADTQRLPARSVVVTIDDGYRNILTTALPLLKRLKVPATVFVLTGPERERRMWIDRLEWAIEAAAVSSLRWEGRTFPLTSIAEKAEAMQILPAMLQGLGGQRETALETLLGQLGNSPEEVDPDRDLLSWDEVRALRDAGLEIGSHADCHEPLTQRRLEEAESALTKSREMLEWQVGPGRYALSYPYGAWTQELAQAVRKADFSCAVTGEPGLNRTGGNLFSLRRLLVGADDDITRLRASLSGLRSFWRRIGPGPSHGNPL